MNHSYSMEISKQFRNNNSSELRNSAKLLEQAIRFSLPDGGHILEVEDNKTLRELYQHLIPIIRLPYDLMTIEYTLSANGQAEPIQFVLLLRQQEKTIDCEMYYKQIGFKFWSSASFVVKINADWADFKVILNAIDDSNLGEVEKLHSRQITSVVLNFLSALSCSNLSIKDVSVKLNGSNFRNKKQKKEQPETIYKVLVIDTNTTHSDSETSGGKESVSRKVHLRRGHIRHLKNKMIWVNSCVVGNKKNGKVEKSYKVV